MPAAQTCSTAVINEPRTVFRANLEFHRVFFAACGNPYLAEQIIQLASRAHAIRFHAISDESPVNRARNEHLMMIDHLEKGDRGKLMELVAAHIKPSKEAYLRLDSTQVGQVVPLGHILFSEPPLRRRPAACGRRGRRLRLRPTGYR
jgi:DNA-binding GntR family transcriptional regulator